MLHALQKTSQPSARRGFSVIEILVVIGIIVVLLSLIVVAVNRARATAQATNTVALMSSIKQGLTQFREDMGYLPPVLDADEGSGASQTGRGLTFDGAMGTLPASAGGGARLNGPDPQSGDYRELIQDWYSVTTLAEYLIGYGGVSEDGHEGPGIRNPGRDAFWGATVNHPGLTSEPGTFAARQEFLDPENDFPAAGQYRRGAVYGPYLQLRDERLLGRLISTEPDDNGTWDVAFPGESRFDEFPERPLVICDYWGQPIHYYRLPHPPGLPGERYRRPAGAGTSDFHQPSISDVFVMRPYRLASGDQVQTTFSDDVDQLPDVEDGTQDNITSRRAQTATFGLLSAGRNRQIDRRARFADLNRTNIVEYGQ